jgi:small-conductance mechanosensitive channel
MSYLVNEILLRLAKAVAALVVAIVLWAVLVVVVGAAPSVELALLCWLSGAAFILLVESSPI